MWFSRRLMNRVAVGGVVFPLSSAAAVTIDVPGDFPTIQDAVNAAIDGDEIVVAPGTYNELIDFLGMAITVRSSGGPAVTSIDGTGLAGSVVTCIAGEGPSTVLLGFTITGGNLDAGGGMFNIFSSPTVTNCVFSGNTGDLAGGMLNFASDPTVTSCTFSGNSVAAWLVGCTTP